MIMGGSTATGISNASWIYDFDDSTDEWKEGPSMPVAWESHTCGLIADTEDGTVMVVVAGGDASPKVTYLWVIGTDKWNAGPWLTEGTVLQI